MTYFYTAAELGDRIERYFLSVRGEAQLPEKPALKSRKKESPEVIRITSENKTDPPLLTGLALFLGFPSLKEFEAYEQKGIWKKKLQEARLRIACEYEKKLHKPSPAGAIFALKCMGWNDGANAGSKHTATGKIQINITHTGPALAKTETEVEV